MGRAYTTELRELPSTYVSAGGPLPALDAALEASSGRGIIAVASGGAGAAAQLFAWLHDRYAAHISQATTPLGLESLGAAAASAAVWLLSSSGKNVDILRALRVALRHEPRGLGVLTARATSPLLAAASSAEWITPVVVPSRSRDGFLATNSLLSFAVALAQAYSRRFDPSAALPLGFEDFDRDVTFESLRTRCADVLSMRTVVVLYGAATHVGAFDLESRFTEAALGEVLPADYRNFAHGRHHWLAKRGDETGVLAFVSDSDATLATKTLARLPKGIRVAQVRVTGHPVHAQLKALVASMRLAQVASELVNIDPGRPGVPKFGSQLYHLKVPGLRAESVREAAVRRKRAALSVRSEPDWKRALDDFIEKLGGASVSALVLDYDGTLVSGKDRFTGIRKEVQAQLQRLLRGGIPIGIATGRGRSVREDLRGKLPRDVWSRVLVGYYNGGEIDTLAAEGAPTRSDAVCDSLAPVRDALEAHPPLKDFAEITYRQRQITIEPVRRAEHDLMWRLVAERLAPYASTCRVTKSSHSIDVVPVAVSKTLVISEVRRRYSLDERTAILCIGDQGGWPGNDHDLLSQAYALSVDEVSASLTTCWNLAPTAERGVAATVRYLSAVRLGDRSATVAVNELLAERGAK